ncbi:hypothetical protein V7087_26035 [Neobacillus niacini]|uniref:hypothetical protein n=1 Tax=Neobacillus niacini TaxID=86668 RepID=UPI003000F385
MEFYHFCTIIGKEYLLKGLALHDSLEKHAKNFHLWICCLDDISLQFLKRMNLKNVTLIPLESIEDEQLLSVKKSRTPHEYSFTLKSPLVLYILNNYNFVNSIMYIDGDLYFYSDPKPILNQWGDGSIFICEQRLAKNIEDSGTYQAGLIGFKRDSNAFQCLEWWRTKCLEWCFHWHEEDLWTDQKYLNKWPELFSGVIISNDSGINIGPWNEGNYESTPDFNVSNGEVYINNHKLVVYHFSGFVILNELEFDLCNYCRVNEDTINHVYIPYIRAIQKAIERVKSIDDTFTYGFALRMSREKAIHYYKYSNN